MARDSKSSIPTCRAPAGYTRENVKRILLYSVAGGMLLTALKYIEYQHFVREYPGEVYGGLVALIFTAIGVYFGLRWTTQREVARTPFVVDTAKVAELRITKREHEILALIAQGLSNREIAETLFVSENTVKTHSSRLFDKMDVRRRVQAVQKARELGLIG